MIKVKELMTLERLLLEINAKFKFELNFNDAYKLYEHLKSVGRITDYAFLLQDEFHKKFNDKDKLKEYHETIINSNVEFETKDIIQFIEYVNEMIKNENFNKLIQEIKFW